MRVLWPGQDVEWGGGGGLNKKGESEKKEEERGMEEGTWANSCTKGGLGGQDVGCE